MGVERVDYSSDEDYQQAQQMESWQEQQWQEEQEAKQAEEQMIAEEIEKESVPLDGLVIPKIAEVKKKIRDHFEGEAKILVENKPYMSEDAYKFRFSEMQRQADYVLAILDSNFSA
jgi:hypothetical protein